MRIYSVYICGAARTAHGKDGGALEDFSASELSGIAIKGLLQKHEVPCDAVRGVIMGQVLTAGERQNPARHAALLGGLPDSCSAMTVNKVCSSSMAALECAVEKIQLGKADIMIAGGMEKMSDAPLLVRKQRKFFGDDTIEHLLEMKNPVISKESIALDSRFYDGLTEPSQEGNPTMAMLADRCAREFKIPRDAQEDYSYKSCLRAHIAYNKGYLQKHIIPVETTKGGLLERDECLRALDFEKMKNMLTVSGCDTMTGATMSQIADGAAALLVAGEDAIDPYSLKPLARIVDFVTFSHDVCWYTTAPIGAIKELLKCNKLKVSDIGCWEVNEAAPVVPICVARELLVPYEKMNMWGGAIGLGHPIGASGARIVMTLALQMHILNERYGIAAICNGGGEAMAVLLERV